MRGRLGWIHGHLLSRCLSCSRKCIHPALLLKPFGNFQSIDIQTLPPSHFIADLMQLPIVTTAERNGELIADFETQGSSWANRR